MSVLTTVKGRISKPDGTTVTSGSLIISLSKPFVSIDGNNVFPFRYVYSIPNDGAIEINIAATENTVSGSSHSSLTPSESRVYMIEFDPDTTTKLLQTKDGYFKVLLSIPHVSDTAIDNVFYLSSVATPVTTNITGSLCSTDGSDITSGVLRIKPTRAFTGIDGSLVAPFIINYTVTGPVDLNLFATHNILNGSVYTSIVSSDVRYVLEFNPTPLVTTTTLTSKDGYFKNTVKVYHISDTTNETTFGSLHSDEMETYSKRYGYGSVLDNSAGMLTLEQKALLTSGNNIINSGLHTHALSGTTFFTFVSQTSIPAAPVHNSINLFYLEDSMPKIDGTVVASPGLNSLCVTYENQETLMLFSKYMV